MTANLSGTSDGQVNRPRNETMPNTALYMQTIDQQGANVKRLVVQFAYFVVIADDFASSVLTFLGSEIENDDNSFR